MKSRAAVAWEAGKPLAIEEVEVEGPRAGEVLVRVIATGVCHTDAFTLSGQDPEGIFPSILGHEGGGVVEEVGAGVTSVKPGDHVIPLYTPECGNCKFCLSGKTNLCQAIRATQGKGLMPDGTTRFSQNGKPIYHYMGTLDLLRVHGAARDRAREDRQGGAARQGLPARLRHHDRHRRGAEHREGATPVRPSRCSASAASASSVIQGAVMAGAARIIGVDINPAKFELARQLGATDCVNPRDYDRPHPGGRSSHMTDGGVDYSFECIGNVELMRAALECCHKGWGESVIIGVAGAGQEIRTRPFQLVTGRVWRGSAFGGVQGPQRSCPATSQRYMTRRDRSRPLHHAHDAARAHQRGVRPDARGQEHPHRHPVLRTTCPWNDIESHQVLRRAAELLHATPPRCSACDDALRGLPAAAGGEARGARCSTGSRA